MDVGCLLGDLYLLNSGVGKVVKYVNFMTPLWNGSLEDYFGVRVHDLDWIRVSYNIEGAITDHDESCHSPRS